MTSREDFDRWALPGIERCAEADTLVLERDGHDSIQRPYNEMLDEVCAHPDLEAVVLLHQDFELRDPDALVKVRSHIAERGAALLGIAGAVGVTSLPWRGAEFVGVNHAPDVQPVPLRYSGTYRDGEVDVVDGQFMALAPWVARQLRFDETFLEDFHGYDLDLSLQVRMRGGRAMVDGSIEYAHHVRRLIADPAAWRRAGRRWQRKWDMDYWPPEWEHPGR